MQGIVELLKQKIGEGHFTVSEFRGNRRVVVAAEQSFAAMKFLKEHGGFDMLADITGIDYLTYPGAKDRYGVVYSLTNTSNSERLFIKVMLNDPDPTVDSVWPLWMGADWMEREIFDLFGIRFEGHPDLRRILMPPEFAAYPLRKDYPLRGRGERHNFPVVTRAES